MRYFDAHLHLWDVDAVPLSWFRDEDRLPRRADLTEAADAMGEALARPVAAVVVQAGDTLEELRWLLARAERDPLVSKVVAQYEPRGGSWAGGAQPVIDHPALAGVRLAAPTRAADLSDVADLDALAAGLASTGRVLETLIRPAQLPAVAALADRHPGLSVVVCHLGLGPADPDDEWRAGMSAVAAHEGITAKVSGLHRAGADRTRVAGVLSEAVQTLGAHRLMFGSDWPVSTRSCGYGETVARTAAALPAMSSIETESFWWGLASRLYRV